MSRDTLDLVKRKDAAPMLGLSLRQLDRLPLRRVKQGRLVSYYRSDLEQWVSIHTEPPRRRNAA